MDDTLDDFGYGGEIGDWTVVRKIFCNKRNCVLLHSELLAFRTIYI